MNARTSTEPITPDVERAAILEALASASGNRARTADALGIGIATLYRKLKQYGADGVPDEVASGTALTAAS